MSKKWSMNYAARAVAFLMAVVLTVVGGALLTGASASAQGSSKAATVAHTANGSMTSKVVGTTSKGLQVTGKFTPLVAKNKGTTEKLRGLLKVVVHNKNGSTQAFSVLRTMKVASANGTPVTGKGAVNALATCKVLTLVLGPLDLNLLGLVIHLDKVVLNITAVSGAGNLLGNLLCSVANLLNGGLSGLLGQLTTLLNQILGALGLGL